MEKSLITSQINTAPKLQVNRGRRDHGLITSQINTAPKQNGPPSLVVSV